MDRIFRQQDVPTQWGVYTVILYSTPDPRVQGQVNYHVSVLEPGAEDYINRYRVFVPPWTQEEALTDGGQYFDILVQYLPTYGNDWDKYDALYEPLYD